MKTLYRGLAGIADALVAPAYGRPGYAVRARTFTEGALDVDLRGRVFIVTGGNAGIGRAAVTAIARRGGSVVLVARDAGRGRAARDAIAAETGGSIELAVCDVSRLADVRAFAAAFAASGRRLDALVHNAGVMLDRREVTDEGIEVTFATNVLGPFLLTRLLEPVLRRTAEADPGRAPRVVWVASGGMYAERLDVDDLEWERGGYDGVRAYARTKRAEVLLSARFAARLADAGVVVNAMHPGWADTPGVARSLPTFKRVTQGLLRSPEEGADTIVWLAIADEAARTTGAFFLDRVARRIDLPLMRTQVSDAEVDRLWAACERRAGL